jgi:pyruvate-ferredoxin/flavodoxin oxidoreductase
MTDQEVAELPKAWAIGGDGGMGDIGFQNVSKVVLQNRPNVKMLMLDTQVYSNTGGQNSDSSPMPGGSDMNVFGAATEGKIVEKKTVAESFLGGHGSPFVAQVSMANAPKLYKALSTPGAADRSCRASRLPARARRRGRRLGAAQRSRQPMFPEFTTTPARNLREAIELKGNPGPDRDFWETTLKSTGEKVRYTPAHYAVTEARFRQHVKKVTPEKASAMAALDDVLVLLTQDDVVKRRVFDPKSPAFVPDFGVVATEDHEGSRATIRSRQMVLLCVERRKAWRLLQSKAGIDNREYRAQRALLARLAKGELKRDDLWKGGSMLLGEEVSKLAAAK